MTPELFEARLAYLQAQLRDADRRQDAEAAARWLAALKELGEEKR